MTKKYMCTKTCIHYHDCCYACGDTQTPCKYIEIETENKRTANKWIDNSQGYHFCKSCGYFALYQTKDTKNYFEKLSNFCPNCGVKMKEADNE